MNIKNLGLKESAEITVKEALEALRAIGPVEIHVHDRDEGEAYKATIRQTKKIAYAVGARVICTMPNTMNPIISERRIKERLALADRSKGIPIKYYVIPGLTADIKLIRELVAAYNKNPRILCFKIYGGTSVGNLGVIGLDRQELILRTLIKLGYAGPVMLHCERDDLMQLNRFDPAHPETWEEARPREAVLESIKDWLHLIGKTGFKGHVHFCHISRFEAVPIINEAKKRGMKVSCGVTPQCLIFSKEKIATMGKMLGLLLKCNPAIGTEKDRLELTKALKKGLIDLVETDHAPHTINDKIKNHASGVMSLLLLPHLYIELKKQNFTDQRIKEVFKDNPLKIFPRIKI